jgi:hypothetical protein
MDLNKFRVEFETHKILRLHDHVNIQELHKFRQRLVNITQILTRKQYPEKMDKTPIKNYKTYNIRCHFRR